MALPVKIGISQKAFNNLVEIQYARKLKSSQEKFLLTLIELFRENEGNTIDRAEMSTRLKNNDGKPVSSGRISQLLSELTKLKILDKSEIASREGQVTFYIIKNFDALKSLPEPKPNYIRRTRNISKRQETILKGGESSYLESSNNPLSRFVHDQIFAGILDAGMRLSGKDTRRTIVTETTIAGQPITIKTSTRTKDGDEIALMSDIRIVRLLLAWARSDLAARVHKHKAETGEIPHVKDLSNMFSVSAYSLADAMGLDRHSGNNIDSVVSMINRLASTEYEVDATASPWFIDNFSLSGESEIMNFRFLNNLEIEKDYPPTQDMFIAKSDQYKARFFTFSFDPRTFAALSMDAINSGGYMFNSHTELSSERSGILQRFYNWARAYIGGTHKKSIEDRWLSIDDLHLILVPSARKDNFRRYFLRAVEGKTIEGDLGSGSFKALVYGYFVCVKKEGREWLVNIHRDMNDPIVGLDSKHQQLLRSEQGYA